MKKVLVLILPLSGHVNPVLGMIKELSSHAQVRFYGTEDFKDLIEKTGSTYCQYAAKLHKEENIEENTNPLIRFLLDIMTFADRCLPELIEQINQYKPDLIVFDLVSLHAKYLLHLIYNQRLGKSYSPKCLMISQFLGFKQGLLPNKLGLEFSRRDDDAWYWWFIAKLHYRQLLLNWKYGLQIYRPFSFLFDQVYETYRVVTLIPEMQPHREQFDSRLYKFVGSCISEAVRSVEIRHDRLKEMMKLFEPVNPRSSIHSEPSSTQFKLIYVSLGTVFNNNVKIFETILESIRMMLDLDDSLRVVVALGNSVYSKFQERIEQGSLEVPASIILMASAPQIELLKRASLFVTHAGVSSSCEAIKYGVPMVCLPMQLDQPLTAWHLTQNLKLGKLLEPKGLKSGQLFEAIREVLEDSSYLERLIEYSQISRSNNGSLNGCQYLLDVLNTS